MVEPPVGWRYKFFKLVNHHTYEGTITFFIALNTVVMAAKVEGMPGHIDTFLDNLNYMFALTRTLLGPITLGHIRSGTACLPVGRPVCRQTDKQTDRQTDLCLCLSLCLSVCTVRSASINLQATYELFAKTRTVGDEDNNSKY